jgi:hypothetical protein
MLNELSNGFEWQVVATATLLLCQQVMMPVKTRSQEAMPWHLEADGRQGAISSPSGGPGTAGFRRSGLISLFEDLSNSNNYNRPKPVDGCSWMILAARHLPATQFYANDLDLKPNSFQHQFQPIIFCC